MVAILAINILLCAPVNSEALFTLAEVAVGLLGFAAVTTALIYQRDRVLDAFDKIRFYWIVFTGLVVIVGCFIPQWLDYFIDDGQRLWFWSSILYTSEAAIFGAVVISPLVNNQGLTRILRVKRTWLQLTLGLSAINATPIILNLASWPVPSNQVFYEVAMLAPMVQMVFLFIDLVANPSAEAGGT